MDGPERASRLAPPAKPRRPDLLQGGPASLGLLGLRSIVAGIGLIGLHIGGRYPRLGAWRSSSEASRRRPTRRGCGSCASLPQRCIGWDSGSTPNSPDTLTSACDTDCPESVEDARGPAPERGASGFADGAACERETRTSRAQRVLRHSFARVRHCRLRWRNRLSDRFP
jgi:hypothetical protein